MQPTSQDVHPVDTLLTTFSVAYIQKAEAFVHNKVFKTVTQGKQTGKYAVYTKNDWFRDEAQLRVDGSESAGSGYNVGTASFSCDVYAFHKDIGWQAQQNADEIYDLQNDAQRLVTQRMLLRQEIKWVEDFFVTGIWGTSATPANLWSDFANSDPFSDIETAKRAILIVTGFLPNTLVLGYDVWRYLKQHPDLLARLGSGATGVKNITRAMLAELLEIDNVYVAQAVKASNVEGETAGYAFTHGKHALLCYVDPGQPTLQTATAGLVIAWDGVSQGLGENIGITTWWEQKIKSWRVEGETAWENKLVGADLGYFFESCVS